MCTTEAEQVYIYLTIIRHGETKENKEQIIQGHLDTVLSEVGVRQAKDLAFCLSNLSIDTIIASDLKRAYDTAEALNAVYSNVNRLPLTSSSLLRERNFGINNGTSRAMVHKFIAQTKSRPASCKFWWNSGGECVHEVSWRALQFLFNLSRTSKSLPAQPPPVFTEMNECSSRLPLFLPLPIPPLPQVFSKQSSTTCYPPSNQLKTPPSNGTSNPNISYSGHIILVSHGQLLREFMHILRTHSELTVGFPSSDQMMPVLNNCQFNQFGLLFKPHEMSLYEEDIRSHIRESFLSPLATSRCPYDFDLTKMPMRAACYHIRLGSEDTDGAKLTKESPPPKPSTEEHKEDSAATSGVETLYFMQDDEYAGQPFAK